MLYDLKDSCQMTEITTSLLHLANGIEYSFVEVAISNGMQYGLQAYGNEALRLNKVAFQELLTIPLKKK